MLSNKMLSLEEKKKEEEEKKEIRFPFQNIVFKRRKITYVYNKENKIKKL